MTRKNKNLVTLIEQMLDMPGITAITVDKDRRTILYTLSGSERCPLCGYRTTAPFGGKNLSRDFERVLSPLGNDPAAG